MPEGHDKRLFDLKLAAPRVVELERVRGNEEWCVGVKWIKTFEREEGKRFEGAFANPNVVCKLSDAATVEYLQREFGVGT